MGQAATRCVREVFADDYEIIDCGSTVRIVYYESPARMEEVAAVRVTKALYNLALTRCLPKAMDALMRSPELKMIQ